jgi:hypothetical protein
MFDNKIVFRALPEFIKWNSDVKPEPVSMNVPEWYKKLEHKLGLFTVKGCLPFMDSLTTGYMLKTAQDYYITMKPQENPEIDEDKWEYKVQTSFSMAPPFMQTQANYLGIGPEPGFHPFKQLEGSSFMEKNLSYKFFKFENPWFIETPKGYSCLFLPLLNNNDDRFEILPGIVDTDMHTHRVQLPSVFNGWKYKNGYEGTIKKGTPFAQVIPFKRDKWKMQIKPITKKEIDEKDFKLSTTRYKFIRSVWNKKITK